MKNYKEQTPEKSCLNCKFCYQNRYFERSEYICNFDKNAPLNPRECFEPEKEKRRDVIGEWFDWEKTREVGEDGICDNYQKGEGEVYS